MKKQKNNKKIPTEFPDVTTWAAWLYFIDKITQNEVAKIIGVSRATVIKLLDDAKKTGIASVSINPKIATKISTSRELAKKYKINSVMIVPNNPKKQLIDQIGKAAAFTLVEELKEKDVIGIAWGKTVLAMAKNINLQKQFQQLTVVQVCASPNGLSADFSPELCASLCSNNLNARSVNLMAPAIVSSSELKNMLLEEPSIKAQMQMIKSANKVVFGVGILKKGATIRHSELHTQKTIDNMIKKGAVAAILGRFINKNGNEIKEPTHHRTMGITLNELKAIPSRLCLAGGTSKVNAIKATLNGGFVTDLIIDLNTARRLIEDKKS